MQGRPPAHLPGNVLLQPGQKINAINTEDRSQLLELPA